MFRLGIDMGGTAIKTGVMDEEMQVISRHSVPTQSSFEQVVSDMAQAAREAAGKIGLRLEDFPCVGVGTPSCINPYTGKLVFSNNTNWRNVPLRGGTGAAYPRSGVYRERCGLRGDWRNRRGRREGKARRPDDHSRNRRGVRNHLGRKALFRRRRHGRRTGAYAADLWARNVPAGAAVAWKRMHRFWA